MRISFYLVADATTPGQVDAQLPRLLDKLLQAGQRVELRCPDEARATRLSDMLWKEPLSGFLPHGTADDGIPPEKQPIFITHKLGNQSDATTLVRLSGSDESIDGYDEILELFSGVESDRKIARERWKIAQQQEAELRYFMFEHGRWHKKQ